LVVDLSGKLGRKGKNRWVRCHYG